LRRRSPPTPALRTTRRWVRMTTRAIASASSRASNSVKPCSAGTWFGRLNQVYELVARGQSRKGITRAWQNQVTVRRRLALLLLVTLFAIGPAGAVGPARTPGAAATAWGIRV